jgi:hypothetical protein
MTLLSTINRTTGLFVVGTYMAVLGVGLGATMQNLVLSVQNNTAQSDMGAASAWSRSSAPSAARSASQRSAPH